MYYRTLEPDCLLSPLQSIKIILSSTLLVSPAPSIILLTLLNSASENKI